jgi:hypothetical protein
MKRSSGIVFVLLLVLAFSTESFGTVVQGPFDTSLANYNVVPFGDLEGGGWGGIGNYSTEQAFSGNQSWKITAPTDINGSGVSADTITGFPNPCWNVRCVLSGFINTAGLAPGASARLDIPSTSFFSVGSGELQYGLDSNVWQFVYADFQQNTNPSVSLRMVLDTIVSEGDYVYFDDIALTPFSEFVAPNSAPIPEPGTALLMGLGLAGLAGRRR